MKRKHKTLSSYDLLQQIKSGQRDPTTLFQEDRWALEPLLLLENYSKHQLMLFFKVDDRTIRRDLRKLNEELYEDLAKDTRHLVGQYVSRADFCWYQLMRILKDPKALLSDRIRALGECARINGDLIERLQKLGLLPLRSGIKNSASLDVAVKSKESGDAMKNLSDRDKKIEAFFRRLTPMDRDRLIDLLKKFLVAQQDQEGDSVESHEKALDDFIDKRIEECFGDGPKESSPEK